MRLNLTWKPGGSRKLNHNTFMHCDLGLAQRSAGIGRPSRKAASDRQFFLAL